MTILHRNNVVVMGDAGPVLVFAHGFGCDQTMWRAVASPFADSARVVLFDHVGSGHSDSAAFDPARHGRLEGYAADLVEIIDAVGLGPVIFVGHSVSATIGVIAANQRPDLFASLVLVCGSPCYIDTDDYRGGFALADVEDLLDLMSKNMIDWSAQMAPSVAGTQAPGAQADWAASVCRLDPAAARAFARATFLSDHRAVYAAVHVPTLLLDSLDDALAPSFVGAWMQANIPDCERIVLPTEGHSPHMTAPDITLAALARHLDRPRGLQVA